MSSRASKEGGSQEEYIFLTPEDLNLSSVTNPTERSQLFNVLIERQRYEIGFGVRPVPPRGRIILKQREKWITNVWRPWMKAHNLSNTDVVSIRGRQKHGGSTTLLRKGQGLVFGNDPSRQNK